MTLFTKKVCATIAWVALAGGFAVSAQDSDAPPATIVTPLFRKAPVVDGSIEEAEWDAAHGFDGFLGMRGKLVERRVRGWVGATSDTLYVAIASRLPDEGALTAAVKRDSLLVVRDDALEVFVNPRPDETDRVTYQFLANSLGRGGYKIHKLGRPDETEAWIGNWRQAHGMHDGWWHFECAIPIDSMNTVAKDRKTTDGVWRINLARDWKLPWQWSSLSGGDYESSGVRFTFVEAPAPAVTFRYENHPAWTPHRQILRMHNPTDDPVDVRASLKLFRDVMPEMERAESVTLEPGATRELSIPIEASDPTTIFELRARVTSVDGDTVYYARKVKWNKADALPRWVAGKVEDAVPLDVSFAYYPYKNLLRLVLDINGLSEDAEPHQVTAAIRDHWSGEDIKVVDFPVGQFENGRQEQRILLPELKGEDYEIVTTIQGENTPEEPVIEHFERKHFPWEHVPTGRSTKVYAPFEPITVKENKLTTVLREHRLNDLGLVDQIDATCRNTGVTKPILADPMQYNAVIDGKEVPMAAGELTVVSAEAHEVITEAAFHSGSLKATSRQTWDYDGCVKVELTLHPTNGTAVDTLDLEIPFSRESASLIHANGDRIRASVTQQLPDGEGVVWDAGSVACDDLPDNFCPYIYLGSAVRGLCWFAENDRGWGWDSAKPNLDVVRRGNQVILRVHLINTPTVIDEPRTITFGMLAAPVKPRLNLDADNPNWWRHRFYRGVYTQVGTDINWLSIRSAASVYPAGKDLYLWEMMGRGNREKLDYPTREAVAQYGKRYLEPYGEAMVKKWVHTAKANLRMRYGKKMIFYYNRASAQKFPEFQTFKDEWMLTDLRSIGKGIGKREIKVVPTPSFIDYNLYWYARSFEIANNQGVYWDNYFFRPSFNTEMTPAYRRADGTVSPATGIWGLRELVKRTFIMMNERGMPPITMVHMTSFSPLPLLSFATLQYDWEWKYGQGDVQDRFTREYTQLVSSGEAAGTWPVLLRDKGCPRDDVWMARTYTAVRLLHELDGRGGFGMAAFKSLREALAEPMLAMLDDPKLEVYKYWQDRAQPVKAEHPDALTIVYSVPGEEALAAVVSYSRDDLNVEVRADLTALKLADDVRITDVETEKHYTLTDGAFTLPLKKHDIRLLRFTNAPEAGAGE
ncbi:MAG: DUF6067 family protein [Candidatus Pacebacteria bacterium]|nr:DUF6067 family protein [Candidatus Paceibacterota bacterium]